MTAMVESCSSKSVSCHSKSEKMGHTCCDDSEAVQLPASRDQE